MVLEWRNGFVLIGSDYLRDGWSVQLCWNRREDLGDAPDAGEIAYADMIAVTWVRGCWLPRLSRYFMPAF